jgi:hypothetical protein
MTNELVQSDRRCALAIAHPGHELRIHGWLTANQPLVYVLTDGSGRTSRSRLGSTSKLLADAGADSGCVFGPFRDREIYDQVLAGNSSLFLELAEILAEDWVRHEIDLVVGDAYEGAIMSHDLWRGVIDRAVEMASDMRGQAIENISFALESHPVPNQPDDPSIHSIIQLEEASWQRKIRAAQCYVELQHEVQSAFARWGVQAFQFEAFFKTVLAEQRPDWSGPPAYEQHGQEQVNAGIYEQVVRYREHVRPILEKLSLSRVAA